MRSPAAGCVARAWEALLLGVLAGSYLAVVLLVLPPVKAAVFIAVQQALFGVYLGCSFVPNHNGMPILSGGRGRLPSSAGADRSQRTRWQVDRFMLGCLNLPDRTPLLPRLPCRRFPRPNLRRSQMLVRAFCQQHGLTYHETTLVRSYARALDISTRWAGHSAPTTRQAEVGCHR